MKRLAWLFLALPLSIFALGCGGDTKTDSGTDSAETDADGANVTMPMEDSSTTTPPDDSSAPKDDSSAPPDDSSAPKDDSSAPKDDSTAPKGDGTDPLTPPSIDPPK